MMAIETIPEDRLAFTVNGACAALGLGRNSVYALIEDGTLQSFCLAGRRLITRESIVDAIRRAPHGKPSRFNIKRKQMEKARAARRRAAE